MSFLLLVGALAFFVLHKIYKRLHKISLSDVPGPQPESFILGNLRQYFQSQAGAIDWEWQEAYGDVVRFKGPFGEDRLLVADPRALQYIYQTSGYSLGKQKERQELSRLLSGDGLIWADGQTHKRQRRIMNPAFGTKESKALIPIFVDISTKLSTKWKDLLFASPDEEAVIDMTPWLSRATLDVMGIAAFDYQFGSLDDVDDELGKAYSNLCMEVFGNLTEWDIVKQLILPRLPSWLIHCVATAAPNPRLEQLRKTSTVAIRVAKRLIDDKAKALIAGKANRDVMSLLVQANVSENEKTRMSEDEMIAQMRTLLLAGYETTATSISWILLEIARHGDVQTRLRQEILEKEREIQARGDAGFSAEDFESMPYLNAVLKEGLRYHPAAISTYREAFKDIILPLHKPMTTLSGKVVTEILVPKGTKIVTSINGYNRHKDIFGPDSHVFDPERWLTPGKIEKAASVGVYGNLLSFAAGVRACIGWRFAIYELRAFIVELVGEFEFSLTEDALKLRRESCLLMAPTIEGEASKGQQLPLKVKLASRNL